MYICFAGLSDLPPKKTCTTALAFIGFKITDQENKYCDIRARRFKASWLYHQ